MATQADVLQFAQANRDIRALIVRDLRQLWATLDTSDPLAVRAALEQLLPDLVITYGETAVAVAADFFEEMRDAAAVRGAHGAVLAEVADADQVIRSARWAISPLFGGEGPDAALGRLVQVVDRLALQPGRDTVARSVARDPVKARWARVPVGKTCAFCLMLASRGADYSSERSAGSHFHAECDCTPTPIWTPEDYPEGYDPDALYDAYAAASGAADGHSTKAILAELRERQGTN